ncbi:MAG TPA: zf-HC2 domain-containing protein [Gemmatimonadales bacterium]|nr:zf-HC2 domain-containing protein [Gemmatimonadales bacterium]
MMCSEMEERLNEYVDGTLDARDHAAVTAHLAGCAGCRGAVEELRALVAGARALPRSIEPDRDLWTEVSGRIVQRATWNVQRARWRLVFAAAAMLALAVALYRLASRPAVPTAEERWTAVQVDYERATRELSGLLAAQRGRLQPGTVALVERNLGIIEAALSDCRAALARDPANPELRSLFAAASRQEVELLQWATRVAAS